MLSGNMPLVGGLRFGIRPAQIKQEAAVLRTAPTVPSWAAPAAPRPTINGQVYLSATRQLLTVGQRVRGSDHTKNEKVDCNFRGTILEFIPTTQEGNNTRVKCERTGKVFRVKSTEIRKVV